MYLLKKHLNRSCIVILFMLVKCWGEIFEVEYLLDVPKNDSDFVSRANLTKLLLNTNTCSQSTPYRLYADSTATGIDEISGSVYSGWNERNLYLLFDIKDDKITRPILERPLIGDGFDVHVSRDPSADTKYYGLQFYFTGDTVVPFFQNLYFKAGKTPRPTEAFIGIKIKHTFFSEGYRVFCEIPWLNFEELNFDRDTIYLSFALHDLDNMNYRALYYNNDSPLTLRFTKMKNYHKNNKGRIKKLSKDLSDYTILMAWIVTLVLTIFYMIYHKRLDSNRRVAKLILVGGWGFLILEIFVLILGKVSLNKIREKSAQKTKYLYEFFNEARNLKILSGNPEDIREKFLELISGKSVSWDYPLIDSALDLSGHPIFLETGIPVRPYLNFVVQDPGVILNEPADTLYLLFEPSWGDRQEIPPFSVLFYYFDDTKDSIELSAQLQHSRATIDNQFFYSDLWGRQECIVLKYIVPSMQERVDRINLKTKSSTTSSLNLMALTIREGKHFKCVALNPPITTSHSGTQARIDQNIITEGGYLLSGKRNIRIPIQTFAKRVTFFYTSIGYQYPQGSPYGTRIGRFTIHYRNQGKQSIDLLNGINIDSYFMGFPEKHTKTMVSEIGFWGNDIEEFKVHLDEMKMDANPQFIKSIEVEDDGTWDGIILRGITLSQEQDTARVLKKISEARFFDQDGEQQIGLKSEWKKFFSDLNFVLYQNDKVVESNFKTMGRLAGIKLDSEASARVLKGKQVWSGIKKLENELYWTEMFPIIQDDLFHSPQATGAIGLFQPLTVFKFLNNWKWRLEKFGITVFLFLIIFLLIKINLIKNRIPHRSPVYSIVLGFVFSVALLYFLREYWMKSIEKKSHDQFANELRTVRILLSQKIEELKEIAAAIIKKEIYANREKYRSANERRDRKLIKSMLSDNLQEFNVSQGDIILEYHNQDSLRQQWVKNIYYTNTNQLYISENIITNFRNSGLYVSMLGGVHFLAYNRQRLGNDIYQLYLYFPITQDVLNSFLSDSLGRKWGLYHTNGYSFHQNFTSFNTFNLIYFQEIKQNLETQSVFIRLSDRIKEIEGYTYLSDIYEEPHVILSAKRDIRKYMKDKNIVNLIFIVLILATMAFFLSFIVFDKKGFNYRLFWGAGVFYKFNKANIKYNQELSQSVSRSIFSDKPDLNLMNINAFFKDKQFLEDPDQIIERYVSLLVDKMQSPRMEIWLRDIVHDGFLKWGFKGQWVERKKWYHSIDPQWHEFRTKKVPQFVRSEDRFMANREVIYYPLWRDEEWIGYILFFSEMEEIDFSGHIFKHVDLLTNFLILSLKRSFLSNVRNNLDKKMINLNTDQSNSEESGFKSLPVSQPANVAGEADFFWMSKSAPTQKIIKVILQLGDLQSTILLEGESGTGKDFWAGVIHQLSPRANFPFIKIQCASIPEHLFETELFGYEKGSFTGAAESKKGKVELANEGTLYLDGIDTLPLNIQTQILGILEESRIHSIGQSRSIPINVRFIVSTTESLKKMVNAGRFRKDLYYRLTAFALTLPPLRERIEDMPDLVKVLLGRCSLKMKNSIKTISDEILTFFCEYDWPGNIRQLENVIYRLVAESIQGQTVFDDMNFVKKTLKNDTPRKNGNKKISKDEKMKLLTEYLLNNGSITSSIYARLMGVSKRSAVKDLNEYVREGLIFRKGVIRSIKYYMIQ